MPTTLINYSKCPLKKRPVHFSFDENTIKDEPENLCIKKIEMDKFPGKRIPIKNEDIKHEFKKESIKQSNVVIPTPTYPKIQIQPWNYHLPFPTEFYRDLTASHQPQQSHLHHSLSHHPISPLRGDLHSPSSPSEGSLSPPPPHYIHGRASSVSPPIRELHSLKNSHIIKPEVVPQHRFLPYQMPFQPYTTQSLNLPHSSISPISPSYSDSSSYFSIRSQTPEFSTPEDLSVKSLSSEIASPSCVSNYLIHEMNPSISKTITEKSNKTSSTSSPPRYQCPDCNKSYSTFSGLTKHQQFHCPAAEGNQIKKSFSCKDCDKTYVSLGALKMHIRTHTLPCKCTICGKAFSRPWLLQGHIRTHTGEKPFSCQHCHRAFADRSNLRAHLQTHSDIKKYSCTTCSKTFSRMSLLTKHNESGCPGTNNNNNNNDDGNGSLSPDYI